MPRCTHQGCGQEFAQDSERVDGECTFHPGGPVFHEGLKSWSCCKETNKPVLDFESFMAMEGCTKGQHTTAAPAIKPAAPPSSTQAPSSSANGVETYGAAPTPSAAAAGAASSSSTASTTPAPAKPIASSSAVPAPPKEKPEERDDPSVDIKQGMRCRRRGCGYVVQDVGDARGECKYHPGGPIFHEGSKGYLCCKRRVLDFDDFLSMPGCRTAEHSHLFVGQQAVEGEDAAEEHVDCRVDHYQTPHEVIVSAFAKGADKGKSTVRFEEERMHFDFYLPARKRVVKTIELYSVIDPAGSSYKVLGTKVEIVLRKPTPSSWSLLAKPANGAAPPPGYALTFGVGGRTGTVGGKEMVLEQGQRS